MVTLIGFLFQCPKLIQYPYGCASLNYAIYSDIDSFGGTRATRRTWSCWTFNSKTSQCFCSLNALTQLATSFAISPSKILRRYLGVQTKWYWQYLIICDSFLNFLKGLISGSFLLSCGDNLK